MHDIRKINVKEGILDENDHIAEHVNHHMTHHGVLVVNEMGAPGVGKTTSLRNIVKHLDIKPYVIEGDIESDIDTKALNDLGIETHQINTHGECHLDAQQALWISPKAVMRRNLSSEQKAVSCSTCSLAVLTRISTRFQRTAYAMICDSLCLVMFTIV